MSELSILGMVGIILSAVIVPLSLLAMLKVNPANGKSG